MQVLSAAEPIIPGSPKDVRHVAYYRLSPFIGTLFLLPLVTYLDVNDSLQIAPQAELVGREVGRQRRSHI
jgi:hypothetical protein